MTSYYIQDEEIWKEEIKDNIASMKRTLETEGNHYDIQTLASTKAEMETYEIALKYNIN